MAATPEGCTHFSPGGERDVEDAVPYGVLVCEPPRIAALPNATAHVRRRATYGGRPGYGYFPATTTGW